MHWHSDIWWGIVLTVVVFLSCNFHAWWWQLLACIYIPSFCTNVFIAGITSEYFRFHSIWMQSMYFCVEKGYFLFSRPICYDFCVRLLNNCVSSWYLTQSHFPARCTTLCLETAPETPEIKFLQVWISQELAFIFLWHFGICISFGRA